MKGNHTDVQVKPTETSTRQAGARVCNSETQQERALVWNWAMYFSTTKLGPRQKGKTRDER